MTTLKRMRDLVTGSGFTVVDETGLIEGVRQHADGRTQILHVFHWSNPKIAAERGIPHGYLALRGAIGPDTNTGLDTLRLPTYEWPADDPARRPWPEVLAEFRDKLLPCWDLPLPEGAAHLRQLPDRYWI
ncbi:hypothetical protein ACT17_28205 [Mycolicibacterium conceptionense]|uniref:Uncharacterized protein n=1 Tax=Mycolicibacterium conceptionense TaxID=451644 RepID=A0A0J8TZM5_9MYCO|nr:hypothetical protein [Mycolicibacterium conceptionense]KMV14828.1 hypothetical protein ACT17_28205 [Mycolicibacterium conceptionense]